MAALFEGTLPVELSIAEEEEPVQSGSIETPRSDDIDNIVRGRENVLDALKMDMSSLRIGKKQWVDIHF